MENQPANRGGDQRTEQRILVSPEQRNENASSNAIFDFRGASNMNLDLPGLSVQFPGSPTEEPILTVDQAEQFERQYIATYNTYTDERTKDKVTSTFLNLETPNRQVNPELVITNYYQGDTAPESRDYVPVKFGEADDKRELVGQTIPLENILDGVNYVALVASAGSGKTVSAKRFAQMVLKGEIPPLADVKLVHYVSIAELGCMGRHTAYDLLFVQPLGRRLSDSLRKFGFAWMKSNANKVLLILDGLDQAPWSLQEANTVTYEEADTVPVIFHNILNKDLFFGCRVVITSREHSIRHFTQPIRPRRTVALAGLALNDREYLIKELGGQNGQQIWDHLQSHSPGLIALCETPAFLVFTEAVMIDNLANLPETMSGILVRVLAYFLYSEQQRSTGDIEKIFDKLKLLAFNGTSERRVVFKVSELQSMELSVEQVSDFVAIAPKKNKTHHFKLMEGIMNLFFCHQMVQEALSALHICQFTRDQFETFVGEHFRDPHFEIVIKIILGVILNPQVDTDDLGEIKEKLEKAQILRAWLRNRVTGNQHEIRGQNVMMPREDLPLYSLLHECGDGGNEIVRECINSVSSMEKLRAESLFVVASVMRKTNDINRATFSTLCPCDWDIKLLIEGLRKCRLVKIHVLKISKLINEESFWNVGKILTIATIENLIFSDCFISEREMVILTSSIDNVIQQALTLDFSGNHDMEEAAFHAIGELIKKTNTDDVQLNSCKLTHQKMCLLKDSLNGYTRQIKRLGLSGNDGMLPESLCCVGALVRNANTEHVNISRCKLTAQHLSELKRGLGGYSAEIKRLDLSRNEDMSPDAYQHIGEILLIGRVQNLNICHCKLEANELEALKRHTVGFSGHMKSLDVAWNGRALDYRVLGEIVENWKLEELICHGCFLERKHVDDFILSLKEMRNKVRITHGSTDVPSTTTSVEDFRLKIAG